MNQSVKTLARSNSLNNKSVEFTTQVINPLHRFTSYNYLFTLSALNKRDLDTTRFLTEKPHDVIARSAGIGETENANTGEGGLSEEVAGTLDKRGLEALSRSRQELSKNNDIYFANVNLDSVHSLNSERRLGALTKLDMTLTEPAGITLFEKLRAATSNCGFRDHVDAPLLLTVEFMGIDGNGNTVKLDGSTGTRRIPIKIVNCQVDLNEAGATYQIRAVPYNEFGFMNRFIYTRSTLEIKKRQTLADFLQDLEAGLNLQTENEAENRLFESKNSRDEYRFSVDSKIADYDLTQKVESKKNLKNVSMFDQSDGDGIDDDAGNIGFENKAGQISSGVSILLVLEEALKTLPNFANVLDEWFQRTLKEVASRTGATQTITQEDVEKYLDENNKEFYVDWFKIKSTVDQQSEIFDNVTKQHKKILKYHVYSYKIHVYQLAAPGLSLGGAKAYVARKIYDYIFTGNNTDILDLNINYKVAYFQTRLKDVNADNLSNSSLTSNQDQYQGVVGTGANALENDPANSLRSYPGVSVTTSVGGMVAPRPQVDVFMDSLTNPTADMVNIQLKILGDPAWIGQSQWLDVKTNTLVADDENAKQFAGYEWSENYQSYNTDQTDPIIALQFRMPTDLNTTTGVYELKSEESAIFSGLYHVFKVTSSFDNGSFTQTLHARRFNNQSKTRKGDPTEVKYRRLIDGTWIELSNTAETPPDAVTGIVQGT